MKKLFALLMLMLSLHRASAQERVLLGGVLRNLITGEPVVSAHVLNLTDSLATISSEQGTFKIPVHLGDSLVFSSIGFQTKALIIGEKELTADFVEVKLLQREYQLQEVEVNPFGSKAQFRKKFMELEVDDGTIQVIGIEQPSKERREIPITEDKNEIKKARYIFNPASFIYGNFSKDAKTRQELHRLEGEKERHRYNYQKFNEETVGRITGYTGNRLIEFMDYCNFSEDQIFRYSDYELTVAILNKQRSFEETGRK